MYGKGENVRDWIYVKDHCEALWTVLTKGKVGEMYVVGADCEKTNLQTINKICSTIFNYLGVGEKTQSEKIVNKLKNLFSKKKK